MVSIRENKLQKSQKDIKGAQYITTKTEKIK